MNYNGAMEVFFNTLNDIIHADWFLEAVAAAIILALTGLLAKVCVKLFHRYVSRSQSVLPQSSIFVNVIRVSIWLVGIGIVLAFCFDVNVSAIITALGVGGIAVSLGFQDTISNLIGGLQISLSKVVKPGDHIKMGPNGVSGVVRDVTWRYTTVDDAAGQRIIIPNSTMNTTAVVHMAPLTAVSVPFVATVEGNELNETASAIEKAVATAVSSVNKLVKDPQVFFSEVTDFGFKGSVSFTIEDSSKLGAVKDAAVRAIAPYVHEERTELVATPSKS